MVLTAAAAVVSASPALVPTTGDHAAVVDVTDDDAPPTEWGQWETRPASAPERVLLMREDGCVTSQRSAHDAETSMSHATLPTSDVAVVRPESGRGHIGTLLAHFDLAQDEQALWQEFQDHGASINNALTEVMRVHGVPSWRILQVGVLCWIRGSLSHPLCIHAFSDSASSRVLNCW
jgi:hypothetical protein